MKKRVGRVLQKLKEERNFKERKENYLFVENYLFTLLHQIYLKYGIQIFSERCNITRNTLTTTRFIRKHRYVQGGTEGKGRKEREKDREEADDVET